MATQIRSAPRAVSVTTPRPDPRDVFLRAIATAVSHEELDDLRALALAHPGNGATPDLERAIATRRGEIDRERARSAGPALNRRAAFD